MDDNAFITVLEQHGIIMSRMIAKSKFSGCDGMVKETKKFFDQNKKSVTIDTVDQSKQLILYQYDEIMSKLPSGSEVFTLLESYVKYYRSKESGGSK